MAGVTRQSIARGPGTVKLGTQQFYDKDGINADLEIEPNKIEVSHFGLVDERIDDVVGKIGFTPSGQVTAEIIAALFPYMTPNIGASICGSSDTACEVHSKAGTKVLFHSAALFSMPEIYLSAKKTCFGAAEIVAVLKNGAERTDADSLYTISTTAWSGTTFATSNIKTVGYAASWNSLSFRSEAGFTVSPTVNLTPVEVDDLGTIDFTVDGVEVMAKCVPLNLSESQIYGAMKLQGAGAAIGSSLRGGNDLTITGTGGLTVIIRDAALVTGPLKWGKSQLRAGEIGFIGQRTETTGTFGNLFNVALT
jgi:hypothetical protein